MKCVICGKEFIRVGVQKTCSPECSEELKRRYMKEWYDNSVGNRTAICVVCGKEFEQRNGTNTCSEECRIKRAKQIDQEWYKKTYKSKIKKCTICGKEFSGRGRSKTCSKNCRKEYSLILKVILRFIVARNWLGYHIICRKPKPI